MVVVGLKPKQQLIKFLVAAPARRSGVKGGRQVLALIERSRGRGLSMEIGWWGVGGWRWGVIFQQGVYGVHEYVKKAVANDWVVLCGLKIYHKYI